MPWRTIHIWGFFLLEGLMEEPLLSQANPTAAGDGGSGAAATSCPPILVRLTTVAVLATVSVWANYEASKGFEITIVNGAVGTDVGRRFDLLFVSDDRATRIILNASESIARALYRPAAAAAADDEEEGSDKYPQKPIGHVTLRFADDRNFSSSNAISVLRNHGGDEFVLHVSPRVVVAGTDGDADAQMTASVHRGMARVWLWDGQGTAPEALLDAMADYLTASAGLSGGGGGGGVTPEEDSGVNNAAVPVEEGSDGSCWANPELNQDRADMTRFIRFCEGRRPGFVARLNRVMRDRWRPGMVDVALGSPSCQPLCHTCPSLTRQFNERRRLD